MRVGMIITAEEFKEAIKPAYILTIDFGANIGIKKTSAQITNYTLKELKNKQCIAIINLGDKQIGPIISQCLVLGSIASNGEVLLLSPDDNAKLGDKIA
jgi:tRNA-binding protein